MTRSALAMGLACMTAAAIAATACGGGGDTTGSGASSSGTSSGGTGGTGGTGATGGGGSAPLGPFTSHGAASYEAQTSIAADTNGGVVAVWIGFFSDATSSIGYAVSRDAGDHWTAPRYVPSPGGRLASNPVVAVDGQGRFSLAWLGFRFDQLMPDEHIYVSRLDEATETFGTPVIASDDGTSKTRDFDKPSVAVDADDNLLVTWADFTGSGQGAQPALTFARTADATMFTRSTIVADPTFGSLAQICLDASAGPSAPLYVAHLGAGGTMTLRKSTDQGKNWLMKSVPATDVLFQNITCAAHGSDLWIAYASGKAPFVPGMNPPADAVSVVHSSNGGDAFDPPVNATSGATGPSFLFPSITRRSDGQLEIAYYEGSAGTTATLSRATSANGTAWTRSNIGMPGTFTLDRTLASWLGDYLGIAATTGGTFVSFTENTEGKAHIGFTKVSP